MRLQKKDYVHVGKHYSYVNVEIAEAESTATPIELVRQIPHADFQAAYPAATYPHLQINDAHFQASGFHKDVSVPKPVQDAIKTHIALYFPYFRYEPPAWLNPGAAPPLETREQMYGQSTESIIKTNIIQSIETWILDLILDMELYEKQLIPIGGAPQGAQAPLLFAGYQGPNAATRAQLNHLLTTIYQTRDSSIQQARIGISGKAGRKVSIVLRRVQGPADEIIAPTLFHLSSGELMAFSIGATILREYDYLHGRPAESISDISGIALIDEADLHLHIQLQRDILPTLFKLFPKIQFIVTTHSPFFLLGLAKNGGVPHVIYRLPHGQRIAAEDFVEFQHAYDIFIESEKQFKSDYEQVAERLRNLQRPVVITEGKTDWQHMKAALTRLRASNEYLDLDFDFHEYQDVDMGDTTLRSMCEQFSKVRQDRRVIFIFDRDNPTLVPGVEDAPAGFKHWGQNVYSFCIPIPAHRQQYHKISIELYYTDDELQTPDPATGYRLVFSNEVPKTVDSSVTNRGDTNIFVRMLNAPNVAEELDKFVYDQDCDHIVDANGQRTAHSKTVFAAKVLLNQPPFHNFNIQPFRAILDRIRQVMNA